LTVQDRVVAAKNRKQRTLKSEASYSGIGIHTGQCVHMQFIPAVPGTGIIFRRTDLPGKPQIPASVEYVCDTSRCTTVGVNGTCIHTVEHVLAAVNANKIDNLYIDISNLEPPVASGGSEEFVQMIEDVGILEQDATVPIVYLQSPVYFSEGDIHLVALPSETYRISYTLSYPDNPALKSQYQSFEINAETFKQELAPCRTFSLYSEVSALMEKLRAA